MEFRKMTTLPPQTAGRRTFGQTSRPLLLCASLLALGLAACKTTDKHIITGAVPDDYRLTHPIALEESIETMDVPVGLHTAHLTAPMKGNVRGFADKFRASGSTVIAIVTPSGSANQNVATYIGYEIQDVLLAAGVSAKQVDFRVYRASGEQTAPIRIAFSRVAGRTASCDPWPDQMASTGENRHYYNYGCASQQNLAAMVANPLDLLYPRGMTPADAARRAAVLDKYRKGEAYQTDYSRESASEIAKGVGN
jgi:pilus assembly protein CpaD